MAQILRLNSDYISQGYPYNSDVDKVFNQLTAEEMLTYSIDETEAENINVFKTLLIEQDRSIHNMMQFISSSFGSIALTRTLFDSFVSKESEIASVFKYKIDMEQKIASEKNNISFLKNNKTRLEESIQEISNRILDIESQLVDINSNDTEANLIDEYNQRLTSIITTATNLKVEIEYMEKSILDLDKKIYLCNYSIKEFSDFQIMLYHRFMEWERYSLENIIYNKLVTYFKPILQEYWVGDMLERYLLAKRDKENLETVYAEQTNILLDKYVRAALFGLEEKMLRFSISWLESHIYNYSQFAKDVNEEKIIQIDILKREIEEELNRIIKHLYSFNSGIKKEYEIFRERTFGYFSEVINKFANNSSETMEQIEIRNGLQSETISTVFYTDMSNLGYRSMVFRSKVLAAQKSMYDELGRKTKNALSSLTHIPTNTGSVVTFDMLDKKIKELLAIKTETSKKLEDLNSIYTAAQLTLNNLEKELVDTISVLDELANQRDILKSDITKTILKYRNELFDFFDISNKDLISIILFRQYSPITTKFAELNSKLVTARSLKSFNVSNIVKLETYYSLIEKESVNTFLETNDFVFGNNVAHIIFFEEYFGFFESELSAIFSKVVSVRLNSTYLTYELVESIKNNIAYLKLFFNKLVTISSTINKPFSYRNSLTLETVNIVDMSMQSHESAIKTFEDYMDSILAFVYKLYNEKSIKMYEFETNKRVELFWNKIGE